MDGEGGGMRGWRGLGEAGTEWRGKNGVMKGQERPRDDVRKGGGKEEAGVGREGGEEATVKRKDRRGRKQRIGRGLEGVGGRGDREESGKEEEEVQWAREGEGRRQGRGRGRSREE